MKKAGSILIWFLLLTNFIYPNEVDSLQNILNIELNNKHIYTEKKEKRIDNLKELLSLKGLFAQQMYDINTKLYDEYCKYKVDSAIVYMERNLEIAQVINDKNLINGTLLNLASLYSTRGLYIEALGIQEKISKKELNNDLIIKYYTNYALLYVRYAQSNNIQTLYNKADLYTDSLISHLDTHSIQYALEYSQKNIYRFKEFENAEKTLLALYETLPPENENYGTVTFLLGDIYKATGDLEKQKMFYLLSAISDIRNAIKDNASFQSLAVILYQTGDIDLAYKCIQSSLDDVIFCNVRYRAIENSNTYPIITGTYQQKENEQKKVLELFLILSSILTLLLIATLIYIYRQMRRVARIRKALYRANQKLSKLNKNLNETNVRLEETNKIKEKYITYSFDLCSNYIDKIENQMNKLNKLVKTKKIDQVAKILASNDLISNELKEFYHNFDSMFLGIYPTFVEQFNRLLLDSEQIRIKQGELLSPELRIFALIRLGISDSNQIANYLHYSLSTIYNYRTKIRNKSGVPRDEFEDRIMKIGTM